MSKRSVLLSFLQLTLFINNRYNEKTFEATGRAFDLYAERLKYDLTNYIDALRSYQTGVTGFARSLAIYLTLVNCTLGIGGLPLLISSVLFFLVVKCLLNGCDRYKFKRASGDSRTLISIASRSSSPRASDSFLRRKSGNNDLYQGGDSAEFPFAEGQFYPPLDHDEICATADKLTRSGEDEEGEDPEAEDDLSLSDEGGDSKKSEKKKKKVTTKNITPYTYVEQDINKPKTFVDPLEEKIGRMQTVANIFTGGACEEKVSEQTTNERSERD